VIDGHTEGTRYGNVCRNMGAESLNAFSNAAQNTSWWTRGVDEIFVWEGPLRGTENADKETLKALRGVGAEGSSPFHQTRWSRDCGELFQPDPGSARKSLLWTYIGK